MSQRSCILPKLGRNSFQSGKFSERVIGNLGNFSAYSPALFDISGRKFTATLRFNVFLRPCIQIPNPTPSHSKQIKYRILLDTLLRYLVMSNFVYTLISGYVLFLFRLLERGYHGFDRKLDRTRDENCGSCCCCSFSILH